MFLSVGFKPDKTNSCNINMLSDQRDDKCLAQYEPTHLHHFAMMHGGLGDKKQYIKDAAVKNP